MLGVMAEQERFAAAGSFGRNISDGILAVLGGQINLPVRKPRAAAVLEDQSVESPWGEGDYSVAVEPGEVELTDDDVADYDKALNTSADGEVFRWGEDTPQVRRLASEVARFERSEEIPDSAPMLERVGRVGSRLPGALGGALPYPAVAYSRAFMAKFGYWPDIAARVADGDPDYRSRGSAIVDSKGGPLSVFMGTPRDMSHLGVSTRFEMRLGISGGQRGVALRPHYTMRATGRGLYFTTSVADAVVNYANVHTSPDALHRLGRGARRVAMLQGTLTVQNFSQWNIADFLGSRLGRTAVVEAAQNVLGVDPTSKLVPFLHPAYLIMRKPFLAVRNSESGFERQWPQFSGLSRWSDSAIFFEAVKDVLLGDERLFSSAASKKNAEDMVETLAADMMGDIAMDDYNAANALMMPGLTRLLARLALAHVYKPHVNPNDLYRQVFIKLGYDGFIYDVMGVFGVGENTGNALHMMVFDASQVVAPVERLAGLNTIIDRFKAGADAPIQVVDHVAIAKALADDAKTLRNENMRGLAKALHDEEMFTRARSPMSDALRRRAYALSKATDDEAADSAMALDTLAGDRLLGDIDSAEPETFDDEEVFYMRGTFSRSTPRRKKTYTELSIKQLRETVKRVEVLIATNKATAADVGEMNAATERLKLLEKQHRGVVPLSFGDRVSVSVLRTMDAVAAFDKQVGDYYTDTKTGEDVIKFHIPVALDTMMADGTLLFQRLQAAGFVYDGKRLEWRAKRTVESVILGSACRSWGAGHQIRHNFMMMVAEESRLRARWVNKALGEIVSICSGSHSAMVRAGDKATAELSKGRSRSGYNFMFINAHRAGLIDDARVVEATGLTLTEVEQVQALLNTIYADVEMTAKAAGVDMSGVIPSYKYDHKNYQFNDAAFYNEQRELWEGHSNSAIANMAKVVFDTADRGPDAFSVEAINNRKKAAILDSARFTPNEKAVLTALFNSAGTGVGSKLSPLERARELDLPVFRLDLENVVEYLLGVAQRIAMVHNFGNDVSANALLKQALPGLGAATTGGSATMQMPKGMDEHSMFPIGLLSLVGRLETVEQQRWTLQWWADNFGAGRRASFATEAWGFVREVEGFKLAPLAWLENMFQVFNTVAYAGVPAYVQNLVNGFTTVKRMRERAELAAEAGVFDPVRNLELSQMRNRSVPAWVLRQVLTITPFLPVESLNRMHSTTGEVLARRTLKALMKDPTGRRSEHHMRLLMSLGVDWAVALKTGALTQQDVTNAVFATDVMTQFLNRPGLRPAWFNPGRGGTSDFIATWLQFTMSFSYQQVMFVGRGFKDCFDYLAGVASPVTGKQRGIKGNPTQLPLTIMGAIFAGLLSKFLRRWLYSLLTGKRDVEAGPLMNMMERWLLKYDAPVRASIFKELLGYCAAYSFFGPAYRALETLWLGRSLEGVAAGPFFGDIIVAASTAFDIANRRGEFRGKGWQWQMVKEAVARMSPTYKIVATGLDPSFRKMAKTEGLRRDVDVLIAHYQRLVRENGGVEGGGITVANKWWYSPRVEKWRDDYQRYTIEQGEPKFLTPPSPKTMLRQEQQRQTPIEKRALERMRGRGRGGGSKSGTMREMR
jgi:hypothetical protein